MHWFQSSLQPWPNKTLAYIHWMVLFQQPFHHYLKPSICRNRHGLVFAGYKLFLFSISFTCKLKCPGGLFKCQLNHLKLKKKQSYSAPVGNIFQRFSQCFNFSTKIISSEYSTRNHNTGVNSRILCTRRPITRIRIMRKPAPWVTWPIFNDTFDCLLRICHTFQRYSIMLKSGSLNKRLIYMSKNASFFRDIRPVSTATASIINPHPTPAVEYHQWHWLWSVIEIPSQ